MPRRGKKRAAKVRRLVDPVPEMDDEFLIKSLTKSHRVHQDELIEFKEVPEEYGNEIPKVKSKNKGLNTIYAKMAHLRRRYLILLLDSAEDSVEGDYIEQRLEMFEKEVFLIQKEIREMGGAFYTLPDVFQRPIALLK